LAPRVGLAVFRQDSRAFLAHAFDVAEAFHRGLGRLLRRHAGSEVRLDALLEMKAQLRVDFLLGLAGNEWDLSRLIHVMSGSVLPNEVRDLQVQIPRFARNDRSVIWPTRERRCCRAPGSPRR